jgi:hypothetical protein
MLGKTVAMLLLLALAHSLTHHSLLTDQASFCWKNSYGRGVGVPLSTCASDKDKIGLLCYSKCGDGFERSGFDCHQKCPSGFDDQGLFCRKSEYGRGAGYPWKFGDPLNSKKQYSRCEKAHGDDNCEKWGAVVYPKCKDGYSAFGCCICRPKSFDCDDYGFKKDSQLDLSCAKTIKIGDPKPMGCAEGQDKQAGLCYTKCKEDYRGVGPVCWASSPSGWVNCGMGAATTTLVCTSTTFGQVTSVGMVAINIATFGASGEAEAAANGAELGTGFVSKLKSQFADLQTLYKNSEEFITFLKNAAKVASTAIAAKDVINVLQMDNQQPADIIRVTAEIAALVDPTGLAGVVAAYSYPLCSEMK